MPRKVFNQTTGKHVTKDHTIPVGDVMKQVAWLLLECPTCKAKPFMPCEGTVAHSKRSGS